MSLFLLFMGLLAWAVALMFIARHILNAPEGYEDESGFHFAPRSTGRWHHVRIHHPARSRRRLRCLA